MQDLIEQWDPIVSLDEVPSWDEINISVKQMNNNKDLGIDSITVEILKCGGDKVIDLLEQVIHNVWNSEAPQDWRDAILVSLHKKRSKSDSVNFRHISLLSNVGKGFPRIISNWLISAIVSDILPELVCGFRANHGTVEMIFSARQLQKKCWERNLPLYHCFIDF